MSTIALIAVVLSQVSNSIRTSGLPYAEVAEVTQKSQKNAENKSKNDF
jgi:hypothetical protein